MKWLDRMSKSRGSRRGRITPLPPYKWCKFCNTWHPTTKEYWVFRNSRSKIPGQPDRPNTCRRFKKMRYETAFREKILAKYHATKEETKEHRKRLIRTRKLKKELTEKKLKEQKELENAELQTESDGE